MQARDVADLFAQNHIKRVPILNESGDLVGIVSRSGLAQWDGGSFGNSTSCWFLDRRARWQAGTSSGVMDWPP
jgi:CBS-domain-containing membrane protein